MSNFGPFTEQDREACAVAARGLRVLSNNLDEQRAKVHGEIANPLGVISGFVKALAETVAEMPEWGAPQPEDRR